MSGVLALALQRLALSHGTLPSAVPVGHPMNRGTNGTGETIGTNGTAEMPLNGLRDDEHSCFACGQPARFGFDVRLRQGEEGRWFCAAHRPEAFGTA
jgi:hypothetical protein